MIVYVMVEEMFCLWNVLFSWWILVYVYIFVFKWIFGLIRMKKGFFEKIFILRLENKIMVKIMVRIS